MTPHAALDTQIEKYRALSGEDRLKVAFDLHELACAIARDGIRRQDPEAGADEVERLFRERIPLAQKLVTEMASNYWGIPHKTHDLDFVVQVRVESISKLLRLKS
jgi:Rv0078B-related antitoxin